MRKKRIFCSIYLFLLTLSVFSLAAENRTETVRSSKIVSPAPGTWANYQSLILSVPENAVAFYSFTGDNPLYSGFAYDGPVLLEKEGDVVLRIVTVLEDNTSTEQSITYTVTLKPTEEQFFTRSQRTPFVSVSSTNPFVMPENTTYTLGDDVQPYIKGRTLALEVPNAVERFVPLVIKDFSSMYRIMLRIESEKAAVLRANETYESFPFSIHCSNWTDFTISDADSVLFSFDGGTWLTGNGTVKIDRNVDHTIAWKYDAESDDQARSFILPAKPTLSVIQTSGASPIKVGLSNSVYSLKIQAEKTAAPSHSFYIDGVYGEEFTSNMMVEVYFMGIRQGVLTAALSIDKQPPQKPVFISNSQSFYARDSVTVQINSEENVYYAISEPIVSNFGFSDLEINNAHLLADDTSKNYALYKNSSFILGTHRGGAILYSLSAFAKDDSGNISDTESFSVVVDGYNYYVNSTITADYERDGSPARPFTKIEDIIKVFDQKDYVRLHVTGSYKNVPTLIFSHDCDIIGLDQALIQFAPESELRLNNAAVTISDCIIEQQQSSDLKTDTNSFYQKRLFYVKNSSLYLDNVDVVYTGFRNASLIQSDNSTIRLKEASLTMQTESYASVITSVSSIIGCLSSSVSVIGQTAVAFSASLGSLIVDSSSVTVTSNLGRVAEVSSSLYHISNNTFTSIQLSAGIANTVLQKKAVQPVWADYASVQKVYENNMLTGF